MARYAWFLLLILPFLSLPGSSQREHQQESVQPLQTWNPENLAWSTVLIWAERPQGLTLTSGVLIDKARRWVLCTRHALENTAVGGSPSAIIDNFFVVWPDGTGQGREVHTGSDHYFQLKRKGALPRARFIKQDVSRDLVLLEAGNAPPANSQAVSLYQHRIEPGTRLLGVAQPFSRGGLWHPFTATVNAAAFRKLSYAQGGSEVSLFLASAEQPVDFGYSGSPLVLPHNGQLAGLLLAAQLDQPFSFALISSQEIQRFLSIE